ncbi:MAG TPA: aspartate aminotransferase family protein [Bryobacteraceae bacterium]|nr:aspartate aminotransferase family protein [Bryobacteraceae bacterium]
MSNTDRAHPTSRTLDQRALRTVPGGVHSSTRRTNPPIVFKRASGSRVWDVEGKEYVDYHAAFGPIILGHCDADVDRSVAEATREIDLMGLGTTEPEIEAAETISRHVPSAEMVHFCNSGSEATYNAVRLARAVTGRKKLVKFQGCYHGWHDYLCMNVISPRDRIGTYDPGSAGMLPEALENTIVLTFNSVPELEQTFVDFSNEIAAVILEPIPHNIGCVMPRPEFLDALRDLTKRNGSLLIFDEVITGFRHALGGYQSICGITPDLTTLAKSMANGYPCAALCGKRDYMQRFATAGGDVFFAGTYNAHPAGIAAALATMRKLETSGFYKHTARLAERLKRGLQALVDQFGIRAWATGFGSVVVLYFKEPGADNYTELLDCDVAADVAFRRRLLEQGSLVLPLAYKRLHVSGAHTDDDIDRLLNHAEDALKSLAAGTPAVGLTARGH